MTEAGRRFKAQEKERERSQGDKWKSLRKKKRNSEEEIDTPY